MNGPEPETRKYFLRKLGVNDELSPIVKYRQAIMEGKTEAMVLNRLLVKESQLLVNTLAWLSDQSKAGFIEISKGVLQPLYESLHSNKVPLAGLLSPFLLSYGEDRYGLTDLAEGEKFHLMNPGWDPFAREIFIIACTDGKVIDNIIPRKYLDELQLIEKSVLIEPDTEELERNSVQYDAEFFMGWSLKESHPIRIYMGDKLPYRITYDDRIVERMKDRHCVRWNGVYYVAESKSYAVINQLDGIMEETVWKDLWRLANQKETEPPDTREHFEFSERESEVLKRLFGNDIPETLIKDFNLAACVSALVALEAEGYDVSKAEENLVKTHLQAEIGPVFAPEYDLPMTIMCRSAIKGILYLAASSWHRLDKANVRLFVKIGQDDASYYLFHGKAEVMKASDTQYQVFRVKARSDSASTDSILSGEFPNNRIMLILKMKENEVYRSIFDGDILRNAQDPDFDNIQTDEDSPY